VITTNKIIYNYDNKKDILYINKNKEHSFGDEILGKGIIRWHSYDKPEIIGYTLLDFKHNYNINYYDDVRFSEQYTLSLLSKIYNKINNGIEQGYIIINI